MALFTKLITEMKPLVIKNQKLHKLHGNLNFSKERKIRKEKYYWLSARNWLKQRKKKKENYKEERRDNEKKISLNLPVTKSYVVLFRFPSFFSFLLHLHPDFPESYHIDISYLWFLCSTHFSTIALWTARVLR